MRAAVYRRYGPPEVELVRSLGADAVIDYTAQEVTARDERYDLIFDAVGKRFSGRKRSSFSRLLAPGGAYVSVEMSRKDRVEDLVLLKELIEAGALSPVIDRSYPLEQVARAHRYAETRRKRGNVAVIVAPGAG